MIVVVAGLMVVTSCERSATKVQDEASVEETVVDTVDSKEDAVEVVDTPKKKVEKSESTTKEEQPKVETKKVDETPQEIGASPDAVYLLDDNETESSPKCALNDKELKKVLSCNPKG